MSHVREEHMKKVARNLVRGVPAVRTMVPLTVVYDPDADSEALAQCLDRYSDHISSVRVQLGRGNGKGRVQQAILSARQYGVPTLTGLEASMAAVPGGIFPLYLDLCAEAGINRIQVSEGTIHPDFKPREVVARADDRNLDVVYELDSSRGEVPSSFGGSDPRIEKAGRWLDAGAVNLVADVAAGSAHHDDSLDGAFTELLAGTFGLHTVMFKASTERVQRALLSRLGMEAHLCDVSCDHLAVVESYRSFNRGADGQSIVRYIG